MDTLFEPHLLSSQRSGSAGHLEKEKLIDTGDDFFSLDFSPWRERAGQWGEVW
jgi:hypothetical protein